MPALNPLLGCLVPLFLVCSTATAATKTQAWPKITGTLKDRQGVPLANQWLVAFLHSQPDTEGFPTTTDEQGRFRLQVPDDSKVHIGIHPGAGWVLLTDPATSKVLTPEPVQGPLQDLELTYEGAKARVRLSGAARVEWSGALPEEWPAEPRVIVRDDLDSPFPSWRGQMPATGDPAAWADYLIHPDTTTRVTVLGGSFRPRTVVIPPGSASAITTLTQEAEELCFGTASVSFDLQAYGGPLRLWIEDPETGTPWLEVRRPVAGFTYQFRLPTGSYRVCVRGTSRQDYGPCALSWGEFETSIFGQASAEIRVSADEKSEVRLRPDRGARLEIHAAGPRNSAFAGSASAHGLRPPEYMPYEACPPTARFWLHTPGRPDLAIPLITEGRWLVPKLSLDEPIHTGVLPAGTFTLVGRLRGRGEARCKVELLLGETTRTELAFGEAVKSR